MPRVELKDIVKIYPGDVYAMRHVDLTVEDGELLVIVGPSGSGKTTTLRVIAGLEEINSGKVLIGDRDVSDVLPKDRNVAMVFQNYALYPDKSVFENMALSLKLRPAVQQRPMAHKGLLGAVFSWFGRHRERMRMIHRRVLDTAMILDLQNVIQRRPNALSGGQRQRVALGRAMVRNPDVFLFDEPLSNLDPRMRAQMRQEISRLHNRLNATMIYVTHDQIEAMTLGDRVVVMKDGAIEQIAPPQVLYDAPATMFVGSFIGMQPMNFFQMAVEQQGDTIVLNGGALQFPARECWNKALAAYIGRNVVVGLRPEHIDVMGADERPCTPEGDSAIVQARLEVSVPLGREANLYCKAGWHAFVALAAVDHLLAAGAEISLRFRLNRSHLFDTDTKRAIAF